ncbi:uncharacterized protein LOC125945547 [Dermacentor silvarum]|uniref:uncharacterized protein LOC125945547 n=1 Tax=Dermacentor silvarum TaxID=543639 RepID=UPI002101890B|nr:uncharacterized protein LOC125945547 [Dermacentor silvarum]
MFSSPLLCHAVFSSLDKPTIVDWSHRPLQRDDAWFHICNLCLGPWHMFLHPAVSRTDYVQHLSSHGSSRHFCSCLTAIGVLVNEDACNTRPTERSLHSTSFGARRTRRIFLHPAVSRTDHVQHPPVVQQLIGTSVPASLLLVSC